MDGAVPPSLPEPRPRGEEDGCELSAAGDTGVIAGTDAVDQAAGAVARARARVRCQAPAGGRWGSEDRVYGEVGGESGDKGHGSRDNSSEDELSTREKAFDNIPLEENRKLPPMANGSQQKSRGRERYRVDFPSKSEAFVPLRFVHVPSQDFFDESKRAPSVPDLISYLHHQHHEGIDIPLLSDEVLRDKERESRRDQGTDLLKERLRRAHLRMNSDAESSVTRYRSKSTPSRGGVWRKEIQRDCNHANSTEHETYGNSSRFGPCIIDSHMNHIDRTSLGSDHANGFHASTRAEACNGFGSSPPPSIIATGNVLLQPNIPKSREAEVDTTPGAVAPSNYSVKSLDGSRRFRSLSGVSVDSLEPPRPPPPASEKVRLLERERQARLETERARRRHIALLRERHSDESSDAAENEESNAGVLGQVSFDERLQSAHDVVDGSALALDLTAGDSSVGSSVSIPRPPMPPPPATERERLVERERQARLETERARRRHLALQRERQLEEDHNDVRDGANVDGHSVNKSLPGTLDGVVASQTSTNAAGNGHSNGSSPSSAGFEIHVNAQSEAPNTEAEANSLSYPMERFLDRVDDERTDALPIQDGAADDDAAEIPYTLELFLSSEASRGGGTKVAQVLGGNDAIESLNFIPAAQPNDMIPSEEALENMCMPPQSATSLVASIAQAPMEDSGNVQHTPTVQSSSPPDRLIGSVHSDSSPAHTSTLPSLDSFGNNPHMPRLTDRALAEVERVEHASTGNAAPQSERDEPSVPSILGRGTFSIATQTTLIESATEASEGPGGRAFSDIDESESLNIIRVDSAGSIQASRSMSDGASSASIEAVPGNDSRENLGGIGRSSIGNGEPFSDSIAQSSHHSSGEIAQLPRLTEADIAIQADIDYASIGNAPPHSERDERLSESSITERGGRHPSIATPITEISSVESNHDLSLSNLPENASVEAMPSIHSDHSIAASDHGNNFVANQPENASVEAMPSEQGDHDGIDVSDEEIVYEASMGSSASIEALPSVDLESGACLYNYGTIPRNAIQQTLEEFIADGDNNQDLESAPLLFRKAGEQVQPPTSSDMSQQVDCCEAREKLTSSEAACSTLSLVLATISELPTLIVIVQEGQLGALLGSRRHHTLLASLVLVTSVLNRHWKDGSRLSFAAMTRSSINCIFLGIVVGMLGSAFTDLDIWFGTFVSISVAIAAFVSRLCRCLLVWVLMRFNHDPNPRITMWVQPLLTGCHDLVLCSTVLQVIRMLSSTWPLEVGDGETC